MTVSLAHLGHFDLPRGRQAHAPGLPPALVRYAKFGAGGRAMCLTTTRRALWISGHRVGDLVASVEIPEIGGAAELAVPFRELTPAADLRAHRLDELVGLAEHNGKLCGLWAEYYDIDGQDGDRVSLWDGERLVQLGSGELKQHAGYLTVHNGALWCGRSDGAGSSDVQHGPALYRVGGAALPALGSGEPVKGGARVLFRELRHTRPDWTNADRYTALAFLPGHVCWLVSKATGGVWYGTGTEVDPEIHEAPDWFTPASLGAPHLGPWNSEAEWRETWKGRGIRDPWNAAKGWHTTEREVWLLAYHWPIVPGDAGRIIKLEGFHASSDCGGMAYDDQARRLYVHEGYPPNDDIEPGVYTKEKGRVHVYDVSGAEPDEPDEPERIVDCTFHAEGVGWFSGLMRLKKDETT